MITHRWWRRADAFVALAVALAVLLAIEATTVAVLLVPADEVASELNP